MDSSAFFNPLMTQFVLLTLLAVFGIATFFLLLLIIRQRRSREEFSELKARVDWLDACEQRRIVQAIHTPPLDVDMTGLLTPQEDGQKFPVAPK
jgi:hypothetical protein